jgi:hypothetical protein
MESLDKIKVTVIHNLYKRNKYVNESVKLNLRSLKESGINIYCLMIMVIKIYLMM